MMQANRIIEEAQALHKDTRLLYRTFEDTTARVPPTSGFCDWLKLVVISDSAFGNVLKKKSQGAYCIGLMCCDNESGVGGIFHVLEVSSKQSLRVAKSTWSAELLAAVRALERAGHILMWMKEAWQGPFDDKLLAAKSSHRPGVMDVQLVVDCKGLFLSLIHI